MAEIRLYYADGAGVPGNCSYPHEAVIEDTASLRRAVSRDYVCVAYKNSYRVNANFRTTNCLGTVSYTHLSFGQTGMKRSFIKNHEFMIFDITPNFRLS